jgi:hypothetical protein
MIKATVTFLLIFFANVILGGVFEAGGGMAATRITAGLTATATTISVVSTDGFLASDYIVIGGEKVRYVSKTSTTFIIPATNGRGYDNTAPTTHVAGAMVYSEATNIINGMIGFNIASTGATVGTINIATLLWHFLYTSIPKLLSWNFPHLMVNPILQFIRYIGVIITAGYVIYVVLYLSSALGGLLQSIFLRK